MNEVKAGEKWKRVIRTATVDIALGILKEKWERKKEDRDKEKKKK